jgi:DNA-binding Xre family transcriptional regulator
MKKILKCVRAFRRALQIYTHFFSMDELICRAMKFCKKEYNSFFAMANLIILKKGKARAIRVYTLDDICNMLECQPGRYCRIHERG